MSDSLRGVFGILPNSFEMCVVLREEHVYALVLHWISMQMNPLVQMQGIGLRMDPPQEKLIFDALVAFL